MKHTLPARKVRKSQFSMLIHRQGLPIQAQGRVPRIARATNANGSALAYQKKRFQIATLFASRRHYRCGVRVKAEPSGSTLLPIMVRAEAEASVEEALPLRTKLSWIATGHLQLSGKPIRSSTSLSGALRLFLGRLLQTPEIHPQSVLGLPDRMSPRPIGRRNRNRRCQSFQENRFWLLVPPAA